MANGTIILDPLDIDEDTEELPLFTPEEWRKLNDPYGWYPNFKKCDCGGWKTYGEKNDSALHSSWCSTQN